MCRTTGDQRLSVCSLSCMEDDTPVADPGFRGGGGKHGWWVWLGWVWEGVPLLPGMGERCKLPHQDLGWSPRSFATLLYSNHEMRF